ncbi:MAG: hypothetical protein GEV12_14390 [Micromonosporaceae bacterium]|nr:hypothetical protein [Micromonosporaceae bacterium]
MSGDDLDQPEADGYDLVMPFVACRSQGGQYDDEAFAAGWQGGEIDRTLHTAADMAVAVVHFPMVHAGLGQQVELVGMRHGFPKISVEPTAEGWCAVTFERETR